MQAALAAPLAAPVARCSQRRALAASPAARLRRLAPRRLQRVAAAAATAQSTKLPAWVSIWVSSERLDVKLLDGACTNCVCPSHALVQEEMYKQLSRAGVQSLGPEQAFDAVELGRAVLIDVRPQEDHDKVRQ